MTTLRLALDTGQVSAAAAELAGAPARVEARLEPAALARDMVPLGDAVAAAWSGPYAVALSAGTRVDTSPLAVVVGGNAGHLSGGASAGDLVYGVEYGGGRRVGSVRAGRRARAHTRRTTRQFRGQTLTMQRTIEAHADTGAEQLLDAIDKAVSPGG